MFLFRYCIGEKQNPSLESLALQNASTTTIAGSDIVDTLIPSVRFDLPESDDEYGAIGDNKDVGRIQQIDEGDGATETPKTRGSTERATWRSKLSYLLTLVGYAVGFGNIWRFPYQMRENGGLVFLIPYFIMLAVVGLPIFFLELALGQRRRKGVVYAWAEISPALGGIGIACGWACFMIGLYYNTLIAYCISYLVDSCRNPLPWTDCATIGKDDRNILRECNEDVGGRSTKYYWFRQILDISIGYSSPGNFSWLLCLYLVITWALTYLILLKGTESVGYVVYITALFPYAVLLLFFIGNCFIEPKKAWLGAYRLLKPDWKLLYKPITWLKAGSQIFYSLGLASGSLVVYASYNPARNDCHKDAVTISVINSATSVFAAFVIFPMIGALGHRKYEECFQEMKALFPGSLLRLSKTFDAKYDIYFFSMAQTWDMISDGKPIVIGYRYGELGEDDTEHYSKYHFEKIEKVTDKLTLNQNWIGIGDEKHSLKNSLRNCSIGQEATASGGGTGFVFLAFTEAVKHMPWSNFWSILFFLMLIFLGLDSGFGTVEGAVATVEDMAHMSRFLATTIVCGILTVVAVIFFPFGWGSYVLDLMDEWTANWTLLVIAFLECIAVAWDYGLAKFSYDIRLMTGKKPNLYILLCFKYLSPLLIILMLIGTIVQYTIDTTRGGGITYTTFRPGHPESSDGDLDLAMPPYVISIAFILMILTIIWVPLHCLLRKTRYNMLKDQAPAEFPEEELREERHIQVEREEDQFTNVEKAIIGTGSLMSLQQYRNEVVKARSSISINSKTSSKLSLKKVKK